jgi:predicted transcriptional regulator
VLETLYELYEGNIRDILNSLSTAVTEIVKEKPVVLDRTLIARTLKTVVERRYLTDLQPKAKEVLIEAIKHPEVTNSELAKNTKIARTNISLYLKHLETKGCINLRRKEGKEKYWAIDPKIKWLLLTEGDSGQKTITDY